MIDFEDLIDDPLDDAIGSHIKRQQGEKTWTKKKRELHYRLKKELEREGYSTFSSHCSRYKIYRMGQSALYRVPLTRRGHLKPFRGKVVRLVCVDQNSFIRDYMVGVYEEANP